MKLSVFCPDRKVFEGKEVTSVTLTSSEGQVEVLPGHAPMVGTLDTGLVAFGSTGGASEGVHGNEAVVSHGFFRIEDDHVTVLAGTLEFRDEIDLQRAENTYKKVETELKTASDSDDLVRLSRKLRRAELRKDFSKRVH